MGRAALAAQSSLGAVALVHPVQGAAVVTTHEAELQDLSNAGALIAVPADRAELLQALEKAGIRECGYIAATDRADAALDTGALGDPLGAAQSGADQFDSWLDEEAAGEAQLRASMEALGDHRFPRRTQFGAAFPAAS